jgi:hypothetical protein
MMRTQLRTIAPSLALAVALAAPAAAQEFTMAVDVPSNLGGATYLANQTVLRNNSGWTLKFDGPAEGLGPAVNVNAITTLDDGSGFLLSTDVPFSVGGNTYGSGDVVLYSAGVYSLYESAANLGLPPAGNIDALSLDPGGDLIFSLDAPASLRGTTYMPYDLILYDGSLPSIYLQGQTLGIPTGTNVVGFDEDLSGHAFLMFDRPVDLGGVVYFPGDIVEHDGLEFALFFRDTGFPSGAAGTDFYFPGAPGDVETMVVTDRLGDRITLQWSPSCGTEASDYAVYEGSIGAWYTHDINQCSTGGDTTATITVTQDDRYFVVVPLNGTYEGSYGADSVGAERPVGQTVCVAQHDVGTCP